ncbi:hypothetical protein HYH02_002984 [Chlamydomonas schloesseri]|uniref:Uncharacterized protein n=1 Tax=Chlamydomonas schloesseri TaxID=2026947 RepID=A0A836BBB1_9CHLO|nr:hypothetical protein HYH02_002984 [Chlamydomonas schloesseri]|eukprot:KAG2452754.1 hypothetical protein HYH02_002984 [Chlamydomonas schloesseri]
MPAQHLDAVTYAATKQHQAQALLLVCEEPLSAAAFNGGPVKAQLLEQHGTTCYYLLVPVANTTATAAYTGSPSSPSGSSNACASSPSGCSTSSSSSNSRSNSRSSSLETRGRSGSFCSPGEMHLASPSSSTPSSAKADHKDKGVRSPCHSHMPGCGPRPVYPTPGRNSATPPRPARDNGWNLTKEAPRPAARRTAIPAVASTTAAPRRDNAATTAAATRRRSDALFPQTGRAVRGSPLHPSDCWPTPQMIAATRAEREAAAASGISCWAALGLEDP